MELNLKRPLIIFDLESTGLNIIHDRIVEISYLKIFPDGREEAVTMRINPEMPIPKESTAIHHITDGDVADSPAFKDVAEQLAATFADCDVAGYNSNNFDIPLLDEEWRRAGVDFDWSGIFIQPWTCNFSSGCELSMRAWTCDPGCNNGRKRCRSEKRNPVQNIGSPGECGKNQSRCA